MKKLDENQYYKKQIKPKIEKLDNLIISDVDEWSRVNWWETVEPLYFIEDTTGNDGIVVDLKLIKELMKTFQEIIEKERLKKDLKLIHYSFPKEIRKSIK